MHSRLKLLGLNILDYIQFNVCQLFWLLNLRLVCQFFVLIIFIYFILNFCQLLIKNCLTKKLSVYQWCYFYIKFFIDSHYLIKQNVFKQTTWIKKIAITAFRKQLYVKGTFRSDLINLPVFETHVKLISSCSWSWRLF